MSILRAAARLLCFFCICVGVICIHLACALIGKHWSYSKKTHALICKLFDIRVQISGTPPQSDGAPKVYIANHLSYVDILVLGACIDARFVAKSEVRGWALFGFMAKMQRTVFIKRKASALEGAKDTLVDILKQGASVIIFAEGTSTDGTSVNRLKPGLFETFYEDGVKAIVQPVAIVLNKIDGTPVKGRADLRDKYAWWRPETTLVPHLWSFAQLKHVDVTLYFAPTISPNDYQDRKSLAAATHAAILAKVEEASGIRYNPIQQSLSGNVPVAQPDRAPVS